MSSYVIYDPKDTRIARIMRNGYWQDAIYASLGAARAARTRIYAQFASRNHREHPTCFEIAESKVFHETIELWRPTRNMLNPKAEWYRIPMNTADCCDPGTERYHSM